MGSETEGDSTERKDASIRSISGTRHERQEDNYSRLDFNLQDCIPVGSIFLDVAHPLFSEQDDVGLESDGENGLKIRCCRPIEIVDGTTRTGQAENTRELSEGSLARNGSKARTHS